MSNLTKAGLCFILAFVDMWIFSYLFHLVPSWGRCPMVITTLLFTLGPAVCALYYIDQNSHTNK